MKKFVTLLIVLAFAIGHVFAAPVDVNTAKRVGVKFIQANLSSAKNIKNVNLAYTMFTAKGTPSVYVFNFEGGYVVVAADDLAQPILGYSEEGNFDPENIPAGLYDHLSLFTDEISYAVDNGLAQEAEIAAQWSKVEDNGRLNEKSGRDVAPLINLNWNQDSPYNRLCPTVTGGPGGHAYAGCVADAMAMVMKYWNWPDHGAGTYSYTPAGFPMQTADFENTYYDWSNMPIALSNGSQAVQIDAVARLMWHCGVSVDMQYGRDGSGAFSGDVPVALSTYFRYTSAANIQYRDNFSKTEWEDKLIASLDEGFPLYYSGSGNGEGHAFVCDGYDSNRMFHFNWGWSGYGNSYFAIGALNVMGSQFNETNGVVFDFVPDYIYDALIEAPEMNVAAINANATTGVITWTNPTVNLGGETISTIDKVILERNGQQVFEQENVAAGETMSFEDEVPGYDCYTYRLYYITNNTKGRISEFKYQYGPTCTWKLIGQTTNFQGWNGGKVQVLNQFGTVIDEITMPSSTPISQQIRMPEGNVSFKWVAPSSVVQNLTINIKDSSNNTIYSYSGSSTGLTSGVIATEENDCSGCLPPDNLGAEYVWENNEFGAVISWEYADEPKSFKIYRSTDNVEYECVGEADKDEHQYFDNVPVGTYYYKVTAYRNHCESTPAWTNDDQDFVMVEITSVSEADEATANVYPNPTTGLVTINADNIVSVAVYNLVGQKVIENVVNANNATIDLDDFQKGIYMLDIVTEKETITRKISLIN